MVNIALHISLKNFEQQCNGINIHSATLHGYLFHCGGRRFARLIRVISAALLCRRHSANGRAYPAVIPIAHVVAPDHCFQLFCRVIRTSSAVAVKQLVRYTIRLLGLCVIPTSRGEKSCRFIREIPLILKPLVFLVQPLCLASQRPDLLRQAHCYSVRFTRTIMAHELRQFMVTSKNLV